LHRQLEKARSNVQFFDIKGKGIASSLLFIFGRMKDYSIFPDGRKKHQIVP